MAHDGDARIDQGRNDLRLICSAFKLNGLCLRFLQYASRMFYGRMDPKVIGWEGKVNDCLLYTSPSPRD